MWKASPRISRRLSSRLRFNFPYFLVNACWPRDKMWGGRGGSCSHVSHQNGSRGRVGFIYTIKPFSCMSAYIFPSPPRAKVFFVSLRVNGAQYNMVMAPRLYLCTLQSSFRFTSEVSNSHRRPDRHYLFPFDKWDKVSGRVTCPKRHMRKSPGIWSWNLVSKFRAPSSLFCKSSDL